MSSASSTTSNLYLPSLDGLRAIAFLLVFAAHCGLEKIIPGGFGVTLFFFLSGYLITTLLRAESSRTGDISLKKFYLRRCRRILPPLYITLAVAYLLAAAHFVKGQGTVAGACSAIFYYYNYLELGRHTGTLPSGMNVLWSLTVEEHFYFLFPLLYVFAIRRRMARASLVFGMITLCAGALVWRLVLVCGLHAQTAKLPIWTYSATDTRFDSILWGCVLAIALNPIFDDHLRFPRFTRCRGTAAAAGVLALVLSLVIRDPRFRETLRYTLQSVALGPIFIYCLSMHDRWTVRWLEFSPLRSIGQLSYAMYLLHFLVLSLMPATWAGGLLTRAVLAFVLTAAYATLMRRFVENPIRQWGSLRPA